MLFQVDLLCLIILYINPKHKKILVCAHFYDGYAFALNKGKRKNKFTSNGKTELESNYHTLRSKFVK